jgi:hypothetical protein
MIDSEFARVRSLEFEPYTIFRVRPMRGQYVNVTEHGYRAGSGPSAWPPVSEVSNIFVFGGSTAFGYGVADAETIPSHLSDVLNAANSGTPIAVYNFATPNYDSVQERIRLEQLMLDGHAPSVAVFIDGFDEFIAPYYAPVMMAPLIEATRPRRALARVWRAIRRQRPDLSECRVPDPRAALDRYLGNTRLIAAACSEFAVKPLFVWQPVPCYAYDGPVASHGDAAPLIECVCQGYDLMRRERSALSSRDFLWLADLQAGRREPLYVDPDHYTGAFSREIASTIARHLLESGFLSR